MINKLQIATCMVFLTTTLSGCSESATLNQGVNSINTMINDVTRDIQEGLTGTNKPSKSQTAQTTTQQVTDWTPYLNSMRNGCDYPYMSKGIPAQYKSSIESAYREGDPSFENSMEVIYTYNLKNAVAFGYPIQQIEYVAGYEWGQLKIIFNDDRFMTLRPSFHTPKIDEFTSIEEENKNGYKAIKEGYIDLTFDTVENSITCGSGL